MNDHIPVFSGLRTREELHLLRPGDLREASNVRVNTGSARTRPGLVAILHFAEQDTDYKYLWPTSLPWLPVRSMDFTADGASYAARRANLAALYNGQGGAADCQVMISRQAFWSRTDKFTSEAKHFNYE
jgi:hypothetical protein